MRGCPPGTRLGGGEQLDWERLQAFQAGEDQRPGRLVDAGDSDVRDVLQAGPDGVDRREIGHPHGEPRRARSADGSLEPIGAEGIPKVDTILPPARPRPRRRGGDAHQAAAVTGQDPLVRAADDQVDPRQVQRDPPQARAMSTAIRAGQCRLTASTTAASGTRNPLKKLTSDVVTRRVLGPSRPTRSSTRRRLRGTARLGPSPGTTSGARGSPGRGSRGR